jgi:hypothetical protein
MSDKDEKPKYSRDIPCGYPVLTILTYHILGEPDPTVAINVDTYTNAV